MSQTRTRTIVRGGLPALLAAGLALGCSAGSSPSSGIQSTVASSIQGAPLSGPVPLSVDFSPPTAGNPQTFLWDFGDGTPLSSERYPTHVYLQPGAYDVTLVMTGPGGQWEEHRQGLVQAADGVEAEAFSSFGADTPGGSGGAVLYVTNLNPYGPGSLRAAVDTEGPRTVVFDVAGVIDLGMNTLRIEEPFLTIDGDSGPAPGITLIRGGLSIRTHDVIVRHLRVRPGDASQQPGSGWEPDGISAYTAEARDILVENCSISWAVDENVSVSGAAPPIDCAGGITFRNCIISEALNDATHEEGPHSRGSLMRGFEVAVEGCLFAHNRRRNPVFRDGATGIAVNNVIYDPGSAGIHFDDCRVSVVGNLLIHGPSTEPGLAMIEGSGEAYVEDNFAIGIGGSPETIEQAGEFQHLAMRPVWRSGAFAPEFSGDLETYVEQHAGAWPWDRDEIDARILSELKTRTGAIIDSQAEVGGYPATASPGS